MLFITNQYCILLNINPPNTVSTPINEIKVEAFYGKLKCLLRVVSLHEVIAARCFHLVIQQALQASIMII